MAWTGAFILDGHRRNIKMMFRKKGLPERRGVKNYPKWIVKCLWTRWVIAKKQVANPTAYRSRNLDCVGCDLTALGDNSNSLKERLERLKPMLTMPLCCQNPLVWRTPTPRAPLSKAPTQWSEQAARQARVNQQFEDIKISIFQATGDFNQGTQQGLNNQHDIYGLFEFPIDWACWGSCNRGPLLPRWKRWFQPFILRLISIPS